MSIPIIALFLVYRKLGRVESSMNERMREFEVFCIDHPGFVWGARLVLFAAGALLVITFARDVRLLPVEETKSAFKRIEGVGQGLDNVEKLHMREVRAAEAAAADRKVIINRLDKITAVQKEMEKERTARSRSFSNQEETLSVLKDIRKLLRETQNPPLKQDGD